MDKRAFALSYVRRRFQLMRTKEGNSIKSVPDNHISSRHCNYTSQIKSFTDQQGIDAHECRTNVRWPYARG